MRITKYTVELVKEKGINYNLDKKMITNPYTASRLFNDIFNLQNQCEEHLVLFALDTKNRIVGAFDIHTGTINSSLISTKSIITRALLCNASSIMIAHNHPSGISTPSQEDLDVTQKLFQACKLMDIKLLDHIIIGDDYYSLNSNKHYLFK